MDYSSALCVAAKWILDHKDEPKWWNWAVLTAHNNVEDSLNLPDTVAWNVFTILESRGLIVPTTGHENGKTFPAFKLNLDDADGWKKAATPPTYFRQHLFEPLEKLGVNVWTFAVWIFSLILSSSLTYIIQRLIDSQFSLHP